MASIWRWPTAQREKYERRGTSTTCMAGTSRSWHCLLQASARPLKPLTSYWIHYSLSMMRGIRQAARECQRRISRVRAASCMRSLLWLRDGMEQRERRLVFRKGGRLLSRACQGCCSMVRVMCCMFLRVTHLTMLPLQVIQDTPCEIRCNIARTTVMKR